MFTTWTPIIHYCNLGISSGILLVVHNQDNQPRSAGEGDSMNNAISVMPGAVSIHAVYERLLKGTKADFICFSTGYEAVIGDWYDETFAPKLFATQINTREVVADNAGNRTYGKQKDGVKNQVRFMVDSAESDLILGDDFVAIISFNPANPYAVIIEDPIIVASARVWFNAIWASSAR